MNIHFEYTTEEISREKIDIIAMAIYRAMRGESS
jgi:hypothetical protein